MLKNAKVLEKIEGFSEPYAADLMELAMISNKAGYHKEALSFCLDALYVKAKLAEASSPSPISLTASESYYEALYSFASFLVSAAMEKTPSQQVILKKSAALLQEAQAVLGSEKGFDKLIQHELLVVQGRMAKAKSLESAPATLSGWTPESAPVAGNGGNLLSGWTPESAPVAGNGGNLLPGWLLPPVPPEASGTLTSEVVQSGTTASSDQTNPYSFDGIMNVLGEISGETTS